MQPLDLVVHGIPHALRRLVKAPSFAIVSTVNEPITRLDANLSPTDVPTVAAAACMLALVALAASLIAARATTMKQLGDAW